MVVAFFSLVHLDFEQIAATASVKATGVVLYITDQIRTLKSLRCSFFLLCSLMGKQIEDIT